MTPASQLQPTRARHWVIVFAVSLAILAYIDRVCISQAAPNITRDLGLTRVEMGVVFSAFGLAYALFEIPGGWLGDWLGPRRVLMRIVLWWSFFTAATGWAWSFRSLWIIRFLFGAGEAGCFPVLTKSFTTWLPLHERIRAQGIMWMFARWGGAFTPPLVIAVFQFMNWRAAFGLFGAFGLVWAVLFYKWYRDNPRDHKSVNEAELALLAGAEKTASGHGDVPWRKLMSSRSVWLLWLQYFFLAYPWYFYITWLPTYLQEQHKLTPGESAGYAILPLFFGGLGSLFCGWAAPRFAIRIDNLRLSRKILCCAGFLGASIMLVVAIQMKDVMLTMLAMGMASFFNDLVMPPSWGACMDVGGKYAGTLAGSMNMMGNLAGFVAPTAGGFILANTGNNWNLVLYSMAAMYFIGTLCWPFIDSVTPLKGAEV
jgi:MFS family permease